MTQFIRNDMGFKIGDRHLWGFGIDSGQWPHTWNFWKYKLVTARELADFIEQHPEHYEIYYTDLWSIAQWWNGNPDKNMVWIVVGKNENRAYFKLVSDWFEVFCDWFKISVS